MASAPGGPLICIPIGKPSAVKPQGTEIVGSASIFIGLVLCSICSSLSRAVFGSVRSAIANGGTRAVGVITRSTLSKTRDTEWRIWSSWRRLCMYADIVTSPPRRGFS